MHLNTKYELKLQKEIEKYLKEIEKLKKERSDLRKQLNQLKKTIKRLIQSRDDWKAKHKYKQRVIKNLKAKLHRYGKVKRHPYDLNLMELCVRLRVQANCSYASICKILIILHMCMGIKLEKIPCANSMQNWVSKLGLFCIKLPDNELDAKFKDMYCLNNEKVVIVDESIRLGQEKQLVILSVPFQKMKEGALTFKDVKVEYVKGSNTWNGEKINRLINKVAKARGFTVKYILSDEDGKLKKASRLQKVTHMPEISHAIGTCLKKTYKELADYKSFTKLVGSYKSKIVNQEISYLAPPVQRAKARFMNQSKLIKWARIVLHKYKELDEKGQAFFSKLSEHEPIILSLAKCLRVAKKVSLPLKTTGLSNETLQQARDFLETVDRTDEKVNTFIEHLEVYLAKYQSFLDKNADGCFHISTEIIESLFGKYKSKANNYALTGITKLNLELPLYCIDDEELSASLPLALEDIFMTDLDDWRTEHSHDNQLVKRRKFFEIDPKTLEF